MRQAATETMRRIHALILDEPGITKSEVLRHTGLAWGTVCHHVERLVGTGRVQVHETGKHRHLFPAGTPRSLRACQVALRRPHALAILRLFDDRHELDIPRAMDATGLTRRVVTLRLTELEEGGLLERRGTGRPRFARPDAASSLGRSPPAEPVAVP